MGCPIQLTVVLLVGILRKDCALCYIYIFDKELVSLMQTQ